MRGLIIIIALTIPMPAAFALQMTSGQFQSNASSRSVTPRISSRPATVTRTRTTTTTTTTTSRTKSLLARVTVYWAGGKGSDRYTRRHKTATGLRLRTGHCAVDPKKIPYGSKVMLPDGSSLAAVDTGTAVKNRKAARKSGRTLDERNALVVDRFFETKRQALNWAKTHPLFMPVQVVSPTPQPVQISQPARTIARTPTIMKALPVKPTGTTSQLVASNQSTTEKKVRR